MRLYELLAEAAPAIPMQYINPPAEQMAGGKVVSLTPQQVQIIVKANKLTSTAASIAALRQGKVIRPVLQQVGSGWQVVSGGDILAAMSTTPNKISVIHAPTQTIDATPGLDAAPGELATPGARGAPAGNQNAAKGQQPAAGGLGANLKLTPGKSFNAGKYAAQNLGYKVGNAVNSLTNLGQR